MSMSSPTGPVDAFDKMVLDLRAKARNAALRKKPTMWAYYLLMAEGLHTWFGDVERTDGGYAGAALALSQKAERDCPALPPQEAANLWALGIYARRILTTWGAEAPYRVSLDWLRERAGVAE